MHHVLYDVSFVKNIYGIRFEHKGHWYYIGPYEPR